MLRKCLLPHYLNLHVCNIIDQISLADAIVGGIKLVLANCSRLLYSEITAVILFLSLLQQHVVTGLSITSYNASDDRL